MGGADRGDGGLCGGGHMVGLQGGGMLGHGGGGRAGCGRAVLLFVVSERTDRGCGERRGEAMQSVSGASIKDIGSDVGIGGGWYPRTDRDKSFSRGWVCTWVRFLLDPSGVGRLLRRCIAGDFPLASWCRAGQIPVGVITEGLVDRTSSGFFFRSVVHACSRSS